MILEMQLMAEHWWSRLRRSSLEASRFPYLCILLLVLSIADVLMTYLLLRVSPLIYESNPVARWFFAKWNIAGMILFKFSMVAFTILIGEFVERHRAGYGRFVLIIGCLATATVVVYGISLYWSHTELPVILDRDIVGP
jgi:hypothetical protein